MRDDPAASQLAVTAQELDQVELHSEEIRGMLGAVPPWIVRSGQGYLVAVLVAALLIAWVVRYPDEVDAPVVLTSQPPPASVVARSTGYLVLQVKDKARVTPGQYLGYVASSAHVETVLALKRELEAFERDFHSRRRPSFLWRPRDGASLGDLQDAYDGFLDSMRDYELASRQNAFPQARDALEQQVASHRSLIRQTEAAGVIMREELELTRARFVMDSSLYANRKLSLAEYQTTRRGYLGAQREYGNAVASVANQKIAILQLEDRIRESRQQEQAQGGHQASAIESGMKKLSARIEAWELAYLLKAPVAGRAAVHGYWMDRQYVQAGDEILAVVSDAGQFFGRVDAPIERSGKIEVGQRVRMRFANYPSEEYGVVLGQVRSISLLPQEKGYGIAVGLPNGLVTTYGKRLEFRQEMSGTATIVTRELRLLDRVLFQGRQLLAQ